MRFSIMIGAASGVVILALTPLILHVIHLEPQAQYYLKFMMFMAAYYIIGNSLNSTIISGIFMKWAKGGYAESVQEMTQIVVEKIFA